MGITEILPRKTYEVDDFFARQKSLVSDFATNFGDFRNIVSQLVLDTCKSTFGDAGFLYEEYNLEVAYRYGYGHTTMSKIFAAASVQNNNQNYPTLSFLWNKQTLIIIAFLVEIYSLAIQLQFLDLKINN